jgi:hypothetical protein
MTTDIAITNDGSRVICGDAAYSNGQLVQMLTGEDHLGNQTPAKPHIKGPIGLYTDQTTAIVPGAPDLPVDFVPYYSHTWNGSAYVATGYTPPAPVSAPTLKSAYDLYRAFTPAERKAIRTAAKSNADIEEFRDSLDKAVSADRIVDVSAGSEAALALTALETAGLIEEGRAAEIAS